MKLIDLVKAYVEIHQRYPDAELDKNRVGNMSIMDGDMFVGFVDVRTGEVELFDDEDD